MKHRSPPRLPTFDYRGKHCYSVTCCTNERRRLFTTNDRVECVRAQILRTCEEKQFAVPAGVFMKDHVHLLVEGLTDECDFRRFMTRMRQRSAAEFGRQVGERLWQRGYFEHVLRKLDDRLAFIDYIAINPVKDGLVERSEDYAYLWMPAPSSGGI